MLLLWLPHPQVDQYWRGFPGEEMSPFVGLCLGIPDTGYTYTGILKAVFFVELERECLRTVSEKMLAGLRLVADVGLSKNFCCSVWSSVHFHSVVLPLVELCMFSFLIYSCLVCVGLIQRVAHRLLLLLFAPEWKLLFSLTLLRPFPFRWAKLSFGL